MNSQERKALNASPYSLIFGSDTSPRLLPNQLLTSFTSHPLPSDKPEFIEHLKNLTEKLVSSWKAVSQSLDQSPLDMPVLAYRPQVDDRVFVLREKPDKLHGHFLSPCPEPRHRILSQDRFWALHFSDHCCDACILHSSLHYDREVSPSAPSLIPSVCLSLRSGSPSRRSLICSPSRRSCSPSPSRRSLIYSSSRPSCSPSLRCGSPYPRSGSPSPSRRSLIYSPSRRYCSPSPSRRSLISSPLI
ncbi:hypothetical protein P9112_010022 [Eukaryota sp. TZLM1-RC]